MGSVFLAMARNQGASCAPGVPNQVPLGNSGCSSFLPTGVKLSPVSHLAEHLQKPRVTESWFGALPRSGLRR